MSATKIAMVAVEGTAYSFDQPFSYSIPDELDSMIKKGQRVTVPFGGSNKRRRGIIIDVCEKNSEFNLKPITEAFDKDVLINEELVKLAIFIKEHTFSTLFEALRLMLPAGLNLRIAKTYALQHELSSSEEAMLSSDELAMVYYIRKAKAPVTKEKLNEVAGLIKEAIVPDLLVRRGVLTCEDNSFLESSEASKQMVRLIISESEADDLMSSPKALSKKQKAVLSVILQVGSATVKEVMYFSGATKSVITTLCKKKIAELYEQRVFRDPYKEISKTHKPVDELSEEQNKAYLKLKELYLNDKAEASLLFGVTGSGKTMVFMKLIEDARKENKSVIVLVPEISLTPQAVERYYSRFSKDVAVLHSGLSLGERYDEWQRIKNGDAHIVVGTRSAIFAPLKNIGLIIIDEEQENTYKSEQSPRYNAREVAKYRCVQNKALLLMGSATPSIDSFYHAKKGTYSLARIDERFGISELPKVMIVDMKEELVNGNTTPISSKLAEELEKNLKKHEQSILLINRRGYNTFVSCQQCGHVVTCPNCSIPLTYHSANHRLMCHYCGYSTEMLTKCPECSGKFLKYSGVGTQKIEEEIEKLFPTARIIRMDTDTTSGRYSHEKMFEKIANKECDIVIGTQMVAKGLDFPNVTLVGVLNADSSLYTTDFRAGERTFSLLTQVCGRAGRSVTPGRAVIQTSTPDNNVIRLAAEQDYDSFFKEEITFRKQLLYPPYCDICEIGFVGVFEDSVKDAAIYFFDRLKKIVDVNKSIPIRIMSPTPAGISKVMGKFRYKIVIKCKNNKAFREIISTVLKGSAKLPLFRKVTVFADMNPLDIM